MKIEKKGKKEKARRKISKRQIDKQPAFFNSLTVHVWK